MKYLNRMIFIVVIFAILTGGLLSDELEKEEKSERRRFEFEASIGLGKIKPDSIYQRSAGFERLVSQYASFYQLNYSTNGTTSEFKTMIPFNLSANYFLGQGNKKYRLFLRAGFDYGSSSISSTKDIRVEWPGFSENHDYIINDKISLFIPQVGFGIRYQAFDFYGSIGPGMVRYNHLEDFQYSEPGLTNNSSNDFKVKGTGFAVIIGAKYRIKLSKKETLKSLQAFIKLESLLLKVNTLKGSNAFSASASDGQSLSETFEGTLYEFQWNPYLYQWFDFWDIFETTGTASQSMMRNFNKLGLQLSGFRIMIGIAF